ncbi:hypothetical protein WDU94_001965 [Cyamophila willieti]
MDKVNVKTLSVKKSLVSKVVNEREAQKARLLNNRNQKRATQYFASRGLDTEQDDARKTRAQRMEEFKKEKLRKKLEEQKKKLPPFRAGIVRHALNSPYKFDQIDEDPPVNRNFKFALKTNIKPLLKFTIPQSPKFSSLASHRYCVDIAKPSTSTGHAIAPRVLDKGPIPNQQPPVVSKPNTRSNLPRRPVSIEIVKPNVAKKTITRPHNETKRVTIASGKQDLRGNESKKVTLAE